MVLNAPRRYVPPSPAQQVSHQVIECADLTRLRAVLAEQGQQGWRLLALTAAPPEQQSLTRWVAVLGRRGNGAPL